MLSYKFSLVLAWWVEVRPVCLMNKMRKFPSTIWTADSILGLDREYCNDFFTGDVAH